MIQLNVNPQKWTVSKSKPCNTLQVFITSACNLRCPDCFFRNHFNCGQMSLQQYENLLGRHVDIDKVILLGGEPTIHRDLTEMLVLNKKIKRQTTLYTNGLLLKKLSKEVLKNVSVRVSFDGIEEGDKSIRKALTYGFDFSTIMPIYMIRRGNETNISQFLQRVEELGCKKCFISSVRDIQVSGDYWKDTPGTIPMVEYAEIIQNIVNTYDGKMDLHISRRGILKTDESVEVDRCRFLNVLPDGRYIRCPFDICKGLITDKHKFGCQGCDKSRGGGCLLQKIVLKRV